MADLRRELREVSLEGVEENEAKEIGKGAYGVVQEYSYKGLRCAGKKIHNELINAESEEKAALVMRFGEECLLLSKLHHPNIVLFMGVYFKQQALFPVLIMELLPTSLYGALKRYPEIPPYIKNTILYDIAYGLTFLHGQKKPIIHRDLSSKNVLLSEHFRAKIADLGVAKIVVNKTLISPLTQMPGTIDFMPPEAFHDNPDYDCSLDMFSYGNLILNTFNQTWPRPSSREASSGIIVSEIIRRKVDLDQLGKEHPLRKFTERCLEEKKEDRPTAADAVQELSRQLDADPPPYTDAVQMIQHVEGLIKEVTEREKAVEATEQEKIEEAASKMKAGLKIPLLGPTTRLNWDQCAPLPNRRKHVQAVEFHGKVYVGSGYGTSDEISCQIYCYLPASNEWEEESLVSLTQSYAMTVFDEELLLIGGVTNRVEYSKKIQTLCGGKFEFCDMPELKQARAGAVSFSLPPFNIIVAGGYKDKNRISSVEVYDKRYNMWYSASNLPCKCAELKSAIAHKDQLYLAGGSNQYRRVFAASLKAIVDNSVMKFNGEPANPQPNVTTEMWSTLADLPYDSCSVAIFGGSLIALGGEKIKFFGSSYFTQVSVYNKSKNAWVPMADLPEGLSKATALTLSSGDMLVIGGRGHSASEVNLMYKCRLVCDN